MDMLEYGVMLDECLVKLYIVPTERPPDLTAQFHVETPINYAQLCFQST